MRHAILVTAALLSLAFAAPAAAEEVVVEDDEGRTIRFDVLTEGVDVEWYASILRAAPHADEISSVTIEIVSLQGLQEECGSQAAGCYNGNRITVFASEIQANAHTLLHEYGHHVDASRGVAGVPEPNGSSTWWRARGMARLVELGSVYRTYFGGWDRSIAEIFAEDYARLADPGSPFKISWLERPNQTVLDAILHDLGLGPAPTITAPPKQKPVSLTRSGRLAPSRSVTVPFGLLGPGRRVRATITMAGADAAGVRARLELRCDGRRISTRTLAKGMRVVSIDRPQLGPAQRCTVSATNTGGAARAFTLAVRLSVAQ
jgi:hypothetical protein